MIAFASASVELNGGVACVAPPSSSMGIFRSSVLRLKLSISFSEIPPSHCPQSVFERVFFLCVGRRELRTHLGLPWRYPHRRVRSVSRHFLCCERSIVSRLAHALAPSSCGANSLCGCTCPIGFLQVLLLLMPPTASAWSMSEMSSTERT